jgi:Glu-tRNA(Gln) amidotransferase subunit E-like FAD-binding protein
MSRRRAYMNISKWLEYIKTLSVEKRTQLASAIDTIYSDEVFAREFKHEGLNSLSEMMKTQNEIAEDKEIEKIDFDELSNIHQKMSEENDEAIQKANNCRERKKIVISLIMGNIHTQIFNSREEIVSSFFSDDEIDALKKAKKFLSSHLEYCTISPTLNNYSKVIEYNKLKVKE